jgi:hypothetical protein
MEAIIRAEQTENGVLFVVQNGSTKTCRTNRDSRRTCSLGTARLCVPCAPPINRKKNRRFAPFQVPHVSCGRFGRRSTATNKRHGGDKRGGRNPFRPPPRGEPSRADPTLAQHSHLPSPIEREIQSRAASSSLANAADTAYLSLKVEAADDRARPYYRSSDGESAAADGSPPSHLLYTPQDLSSFPAAHAGTYHGGSLLIRRRPPVGSILPSPSAQRTGTYTPFEGCSCCCDLSDPFP